MADNKFGFGAVKEKITAMKVELPMVLANQAQNYFVGSWAKQGWDGAKWKEPLRKIAGTQAFKSATKAARTRATLVQSGALRRAVSNSVRTRTFEQIRLVVDLPYAAIHNDGGSINKPARESVLHFNKKGKFARVKYNKNYSHSANIEVGAHNIDIPARPYMKDSPILRTKQQEKIKEFIAKVWRA